MTFHPLERFRRIRVLPDLNFMKAFITVIKSTVVIRVEKCEILVTIRNISSGDLLITKEILPLNGTITISIQDNDTFRRPEPLGKAGCYVTLIVPTRT